MYIGQAHPPTGSAVQTGDRETSDMERRPSRPYAWLRCLPILAAVWLLASCAGTASVNGLLVPRGPVPGQRLEEAVVYIETDEPIGDEEYPTLVDRVSLRFA